MSIITESEKKRLQALKEKKRVFKAREEIIRQALSNLDTTKNKKIIFDDDTDVQQSTKLKKRKNKDLFDSDDDNDNKNEKDHLWNEEEFNTKKSKKAILGNDARFTLDDRFTENDHQSEKTELVEDIDQSNLQKEKEKQLDILESILGAPLRTKHQETKQDTETTKKELMIRYDPTENGHYEYEVKPTHQEEEIKEKKSKKKKRDKSVAEIEEPASVEVSKDIYYIVSDTLAESLKQKEEFSLLKVHGKEKDDTENSKDYDASISKNNKVQKFKFNFTANDAFKCNISDNEDVDNVPDADEQMIDEAKNNTNTNNIFGYRDTLFFDDRDVRFNEAVKFFNTEATLSDEFKNLRRKLKMIVRTKVRKNEKRNQPWDKKRKVKRIVKSRNKYF
ncbi:probable RNA-binding protein CG14230 [Linepithema humile]|uniref:probable RNA-binding protein CG14230 n=1 Tax=Linepithema humile TaxID=83485 RepID=UPI0006230245|nr:PREDICTED: nucleolar protein 8-like [Linepithema humile]